jgi:hypothetical protein
VEGHEGVVFETVGDAVYAVYAASAQATDAVAAAHGGQGVLSEAVAAVVRNRLPDGAALRDAGKHRLKDLARGTLELAAYPRRSPATNPPSRPMPVLDVPYRVVSRDNVAGLAAFWAAVDAGAPAR